MQDKIKEWINTHEKKWNGCRFAISREVFVAAADDIEMFKILPFNGRLFCNSMDREAILHYGGKQIIYPSMISIIQLYQSIQCVEEDDVTVWLYANAFPLQLYPTPPTFERIAMLYVNCPSDIEPCNVLMKDPILGIPLYDIVKEEMMKKTSPSAEFNAFFDEMWKKCIVPARKNQHRASLFAIPIITNERDMSVAVDNICVSQTLDVMRSLMIYFDQTARIDQTDLRGIQYAWFDRTLYSSFFMILHGISLINRSRLPIAFKTHPIQNLAHYYERYENNAVPFATSAWFFAYMQSSWPRTGAANQFCLIAKDIRPRIQEVVNGASRVNLLSVLHNAYKKPTLNMIGITDLVQTLQCALMEPRWIDNHPPADFTILIRSTLLRMIVENIALAPWNDAWKASILNAADALDPGNFEEVSYIELQQYGAHLCASMWSQRMDILHNHCPPVHPAWEKTLSMVSEYGFRMLFDAKRSKKETLTAIRIPAGMICFMERLSAYSTVEVVLRLFEVYWCSECRKGYKCGHLMHDKETRADVDLCDEKVDSLSTFSQATPFAMVDAWMYHLFCGVADPSVCQQVMLRASFLPLTLLFH